MGKGQREGGLRSENLRCGFQFNDFSDFVVLGYITKLMVLVSPSVKIYDFFFWFSLLACQMRRSHVGEGKKRKKRDTARTPESDESYLFWCSTRVGHQHIAKNGVSVQPSICGIHLAIHYFVIIYD